MKGLLLYVWVEAASGETGQSSPIQTNHNPAALVNIALTYLLLALYFLWLWV